MHWDLYRPGAGWFGELSPASQPLEMTVTVMDSANLTQRLFLPLIVRGAEPSEACSDLLVNGGAEMDQVWEFVGGWPGVYSSMHVRSGESSHPPGR